MSLISPLNPVQGLLVTAELNPSQPVNPGDACEISFDLAAVL